MSYDYYAEAKYLAETLKEEGFGDWALRILSAMEEGVTATEILMMLRWNLENFLKSQSGSEKVIDRAKQLNKKIDAALS